METAAMPSRRIIEPQAGAGFRPRTIQRNEGISDMGTLRERQNGDRLNILLITSEDNGIQLSCYGDNAIDTPNLDRLAAEGAFFERAYITQAVCSPSRSSILTGLYPHQNGQIGLTTHSYRMRRAYPSLPGILKDAGYRTGRLGKLHVAPEEAFPFDLVWNDPDYISFHHRDVVKTAAVAETFMEASAEPFFLMVNYADAHLPWLRQDCGLPPRPFITGEAHVPPAVGVDTHRLREHAANYYSCIQRLDIGIGHLLDALERTGHRDDTLVIYLGDHGPQFSRGKGACYELAVQVPYMVRWPGMAAQGMIRERLVSAIDIVPTVLDATGIPVPDDLPGASLRPILASETCEWRQHVFCEWNTSHPFPPPSYLYPQRTVRDDRYKLIETLLPDQDNPVEESYTKHTGHDIGTTQWEIDHGDETLQRTYQVWHRPDPVEVYDLQTDPNEFNNLVGTPEGDAVRDRLLPVLHDWRKTTGDPLLDPQRLTQLVEEDLRVTQTLGGHNIPGFRWEYLDYLYDD
jgi:N-sulfoglucosamine sulfohydrolase